MNIEVVLNAGATIGESPTWVSVEQALYWIDVKKPALYRFDAETREEQSWTMPADIGAFALVNEPAGAVVALRQGIFRLDFASGLMEQLALPPFDPQKFRFNEGACDSEGRFWLGVMFDPLAKNAAPEKASLHSFTLADGLRVEPDTSRLHNGMAWSPDGRRFYLSHSLSKEVFGFAYDAPTGQLGTRSLFVQVDGNRGIPDGAAVDTAGGYWCALHGAGRLRGYTAEGAIDRDILLPVSQPTMCAFGGEALDTLYVTSSSDQLTPEQREREPLAGSLLSLRPGVTGVVRPYLVR